MAIIHSVFMPGYHGKIANTKYFSEKHRTSVAHFLNDGKWDSLEVERSFRKQVVDTVYHESRKSGQPVFCIVDDTIASHTAPSSQALHPIEAAYYHMSHLKKVPRLRASGSWRDAVLQWTLFELRDGAV